MILIRFTCGVMKLPKPGTLPKRFLFNSYFKSLFGDSTRQLCQGALSLVREPCAPRCEKFKMADGD